MTDMMQVSIPAHGTVRFEPDHAHLMLEHPSALKAGDHVTMTLTFRHAGPVTVTLPVLPYGSPPPSG
jgi:copper(I)-binding protein